MVNLTVRAFAAFLATGLGRWIAKNIAPKVDPWLLRATAGRLSMGLILPSALLNVARGLGLAVPELRAVMYDLPLTSSESRPRHLDPCPLSSREVQVLRGLAQGKVYKQIAAELGLSTSTVRTHLHNVYGKLGAMDRAQAVLIATKRGWI